MKLSHFSCDTEANFLAAFGRENFADFAENLVYWQKIAHNPNHILRVIEYHAIVLGSVILYPDDSHQEITYWIDRNYWGQGIATQAVKMFLDQVFSRPIYARVAADNLGSIRVLELNGFQRIGNEFSYAVNRKGEIEEIIYRLDEE